MKASLLIDKIVPILFSTFFSIGICTSLTMCLKAPNVVSCPAPKEEIPSKDFKVIVDGKSVFVYQARVSAMPVNQVYTGYQRPKEQTEIASFSYFDIPGPVSIEVISNIPIQSVDIRPKSYNINPKVDGNIIKLNISRPCKIIVEVNGWHNALHLFANRIPINSPHPDDPNVRYFGPGIHREGVIEMKENETVYIAGGAIVYGRIEAKDLSNIRILGRGILDGSMLRKGAGDLISLSGCSNVFVDGIICRDPPTWTIRPQTCQDVKISDIKLIGLWRYNADGIDICNTQNVVITDCFLRTFDDTIVIKGMPNRSNPNEKEKNVKNIEVDNCVLWNDWGRPLEIGVETNADSIGNIVFRDCDIIHYVHVAMDIQNGDRGIVHDVSFENIRIEEPIIHNGEISDYRTNLLNHKYDPAELGKLIELNIRKTAYNKESVRGRISNIRFKDITFDGSLFPQLVFEGLDDEHMIENITFENIIINGRKINNLHDGNMRLNEYTKNFEFK